MRRRGVGIGAVQRKQARDKKYEDAGEVYTSSHAAHVQEQLSVFRSNLEDFCRCHASQIKKDPEFRRQFQTMCATIGVDPLASTKGFWSELLGVGDFYYELAVQILELGILTRDQNGGFMSMDTLLRHLRRRRRYNESHHNEISEDDVRRAVSKLKILGAGFQLLESASASGRQSSSVMIVTVPLELNSDTSTLLTLNSRFLNTTVLRETLGWEEHRSTVALELLARQGLLWLDHHHHHHHHHHEDQKDYYYVSSLAFS